MNRMFVPLIFIGILLLICVITLLYDKWRVNVRETNTNTVFGVSNMVVGICVIIFLLIHGLFNDPKQKTVYKLDVNEKNSLYTDRTLCIKTPLKMFTFTLSDSISQTNTINHLSKKDTSIFYYITKKNIYGGLPSTGLSIVHKRKKEIKDTVPNYVKIHNKSPFLNE